MKEKLKPVQNKVAQRCPALAGNPYRVPSRLILIPQVAPTYATSPPILPPTLFRYRHISLYFAVFRNCVIF